MTLDIAPGRRAHLAAIGRVGGLTTSARSNMARLSATGRAAFLDSFSDGHSCKRCPETVIPSDLPADERERRAYALYRSHMARIALR